MKTNDELLEIGKPSNLDEAIRLFKLYCRGKGSFDELDMKEFILADDYE